jgi:hypothetical protein
VVPAGDPGGAGRQLRSRNTESRWTVPFEGRAHCLPCLPPLVLLRAPATVGQGYYLAWIRTLGCDVRLIVAGGSTLTEAAHTNALDRRGWDRSPLPGNPALWGPINRRPCGRLATNPGTSIRRPVRGGVANTLPGDFAPVAGSGGVPEGRFDDPGNGGSVAAAHGHAGSHRHASG